MIMKRNYSSMLVTVWLTLTILFCWGQVLTSTNSAEGLIVEAPRNQTVPFNSTAVFSCKSRVTGFLGWEIDGREITIDRRNTFCSDRGVCINITLSNSSNETESVLLVAAIERNNGSMIRCLASETVIDTAEESEVAILKIFDRPDPPTNLVFSPVSHLHLNLSWDAPFIFPGTEINYIVTVRNVNTSEEIQKEVEVTHYIFNGTEGSSMCDVYQFSVVAVNSAGRSDQSENISSQLPTLPNITRSIASLNHDVVLTNGEASINILFEPAESCQEYPVTEYSIMLQKDSTDGVRVLGPFAPPGSGEVEIHLNSAHGIVEDAQYNFSIMAANSIGSVASNKIECFTTDVQHASVSLSDSDEGGVTVTCQFAEGSQALGCHVEFLIQSSVKSMNVSKNDSLATATGVITLAYPLTCYDICAYDWESDGTRGEVCVPVRVDQSGDSTDCGSGPDPETDGGSSQSLGVILGGAVGGVVAVLAVMVTAVVILRVKVYWRKATVTLEMSTNQAYGVVPVNSTTSVAGRREGIANDERNNFQMLYDNDEEFKTEMNTAYATIS